VSGIGLTSGLAAGKSTDSGVGQLRAPRMGEAAHLPLARVRKMIAQRVASGMGAMLCSH